MNILKIQISKDIATLIIDSPPVNALSSGLLSELAEALDQIEEDQSVKVVILKGDGRFFSAGADINEFTNLKNSTEINEFTKKGQTIFDRIENFHIPVIASIHGAALGGGLELAMACHMRIATDDAQLGLPELTLGIIPGYAGTQRLPQLVGAAKAYEMILSGEAITGKQAVTVGLVNQAVTKTELDQTTKFLAEKISAKSKPSIKAIMKLISHAKSKSFETGIQAEREFFTKVFTTEDAKEGIQAFIEKREPNFKDR